MPTKNSPRNTYQVIWLRNKHLPFDESGRPDPSKAQYQTTVFESRNRAVAFVQKYLGYHRDSMDKSKPGYVLRAAMHTLELVHIYDHFYDYRHKEGSTIDLKDILEL